MGNDSHLSLNRPKMVCESIIITYLYATGEAFSNPQGHGDGLSVAEPSGVLAVRGGDPRAAPPDHHLLALPSHGCVLFFYSLVLIVKALFMFVTCMNSFHQLLTKKTLI